MLQDIILEYVSRNREKILSTVSSVAEDDAELPEVDWRFLPEASWPGPVAGVDGSVNFIEYKGCLFTVADAEAVKAENGAERLAAAGFADFMLPYWLPRERARTYMSILELRSALHVLENVKNSLVLMDGSLLNAFPKSLRRYYSPSLAPEFSDKIEVDTCLPYCDSAARLLVKGLASEDKPSEETRREAATLEILELTYLLYKILHDFGGRIVWVAKNSTDNSLFKKPVSDIAVLERTTVGRGYVDAGEAYLEPPRGTPYSRFLEKVPVHVYYARLRGGGPVLRFEIPFTGEKAAARIIGGLRPVSAAGYPYVLRLAHRDVIVRKKDIETIAGILGLKIVLAARWYL